VLIALAVVAIDSPLAVALPPASGSNCSSDWVYNECALNCFGQGEEEINGGSSNPHYVACTKDGEIFCCVDRRGGQICESCAGAARADVARQVAVILESQRVTASALARMSERIDELQNIMTNQNKTNPPR
jgi:hypothetical protein